LVNNNCVFYAGQYILTAKSTLMKELQDKIILSVRMMSSLMEMTILGRHHIELNNTTIQWLRRIRPILERSSALYEQMKFDWEEKLQEEVVILNANVEEMFPRYVCMCMCVNKFLTQHVIYLNCLYHCLKKFKETVFYFSQHSTFCVIFKPCNCNNV